MGSIVRSVLETRRTRSGHRDPGPLPPLPVLGWVGFVLACVTCASVVVYVVDALPLAHPGVAAWFLLYAAGLAWGWWRMRPRADGWLAYVGAAIPLLVQGILYALLWGAVTLRTLSRDEGGASHGGGLGGVLDGATLDLVFTAALLVLLVGPVLGFYVAGWTRRGGVFAWAELIGPGGFLLLGML